MTVQEALRLADAGFTKEEILAFEEAKDVPGIEPKEPEVKEPEVTPGEPMEPVTTPKEPEVTPNPSKGVYLSDEQFTQLMQGIAVQTAGGTVEAPKDIDQTLADHFSSILKGE